MSNSNSVIASRCFNHDQASSMPDHHKKNGRKNEIYSIWCDMYYTSLWCGFFPDCYDFFSFRSSPFSVFFLYIVRFAEIRFPGIGSYRYAKFKTLCLLIAAQADFFWWNEIWICATKFYIMRSLCWGSISQIAPSQYAIENMCPDLAGLAWARENDDNERATGFRVQKKNVKILWW